MAIKVLLLFLTMFSSTFALPIFDNLNWNMSSTSLILEYPSLTEKDNLLEGLVTYIKYNPEQYIGKYNFIVENDKLKKIEIVYDNETVTREVINDIYNNLITKFGPAIEKVEINESVGVEEYRGNGYIFLPDINTRMILKGIDTFNENNEMIESQLILEISNI